MKKLQVKVSSFTIAEKNSYTFLLHVTEKCKSFLTQKCVKSDLEKISTKTCQILSETDLTHVCVKKLLHFSVTCNRKV